MPQKEFITTTISPMEKQQKTPLGVIWRLAVSVWLVSSLPVLTILYLVILVICLVHGGFTASFYLLLTLFYVLGAILLLLLHYLVSFASARDNQVCVFEERGIRHGFDEVFTNYSEIKNVRIKRFIFVYALNIKSKLGKGFSLYFKSRKEAEEYMDSTPLSNYKKSKSDTANNEHN